MQVPVRLSDFGEESPNCLQRLLATCCDFSASDASLLPDCPSYVTAPFDLSRIDQFLLDDYHHPEKFFTAIQRTRIVWDILQRAQIRQLKVIAVNQWLQGSINLALPPEVRGITAASVRSARNSESKRRGIQWLLRNKVYLAAFPLHDSDADLSEQQGTFPESSQMPSPGSSTTSTERMKWSERQVQFSLQI